MLRQIERLEEKTEPLLEEEVREGGGMTVHNQFYFFIFRWLKLVKSSRFMINFNSSRRLELGNNQLSHSFTKLIFSLLLDQYYFILFYSLLLFYFVLVSSIAEASKPRDDYVMVNECNKQYYSL